MQIVEVTILNLQLGSTKNIFFKIAIVCLLSVFSQKFAAMRGVYFFFSQHGPEAMMAIAFTRRPSVRPSSSLSSTSTIVEVFEIIIATGLKSYEHV